MAMAKSDDDDLQPSGQSRDHDQRAGLARILTRGSSLCSRPFFFASSSASKVCCSASTKDARLRSTHATGLWRSWLIPWANVFRVRENPAHQQKAPRMRPLPNIADITYPKAGRRTNGGAYCGKGALQIDESRSNPWGWWAGGATLPEADAIFCRIFGIGKVAHTPFSPGRACGQNAERRQKHEQSQTNPKRSGRSPSRSCRRRWRGSSSAPA